MKIVNKEGYLTKKAAFVIQYMLHNDKILNKNELKGDRCISASYAKELLDEYRYDNHLKCVDNDSLSIIGLESMEDINTFNFIYCRFFKETHQENGQFTEEAAKIVFNMILEGAVKGGMRRRNDVVTSGFDTETLKQDNPEYPYKVNGSSYSPTLGLYFNNTSQADIVDFASKADRKEFKRRWLAHCIAEYEKEYQESEAKKSDYPKPVKTILENGTRYDYIWWAARGFKVSASVWNDKPEHMKRLSSRRIFKSKEEAVKAATYLNTIMENA